MKFKNNFYKYQKILINKVSILLKTESRNSLTLQKNIDKYLNKLKNKLLHFKGGRHGYEQFKKLAFGIGLEEDFRSIETLINNSS